MQAIKKSSFIQLQGRQKKRLIQYLDVKISLIAKNPSLLKIQELIQKVDISKCMNQTYDSIILSKLLNQLQVNYNVPLQNREIYYFLAEGEVFVNCGIDPISEEIRIDMKEIDLNNGLLIKIKDLELSHIERLMLTQTAVSGVEKEREENSDDQENKGKKQCRRTKQRRIGHIIEKVIEWRKYYSGTIDESRQHEKYSLDQAAKKVNISKKSLDDYLFQIRFGYRFGFNFNEYYNEKVGILRDFVRQQKKNTNKGEVKTRKRKTKKMQEEDNQ